MRQLTFGSLFAGIGGFDLGFERAGMVCKWQVENDEYANKILARHWPDVARYGDIRQFPPVRCDADGESEPIGAVHDCETPGLPGNGGLWVDVICSGFPCQDISYANANAAGLDGERSGLFFETVRVVRQLRPRYVVLENVAALLVRGLDRVCGELATVGYRVEWDCIPAATVGAPHIRDRVFIIGRRLPTDTPGPRHPGAGGRAPDCERANSGGERRAIIRRYAWNNGETSILANAHGDGFVGGTDRRLFPVGSRVYTAPPPGGTAEPERCPERNWWEIEPGMGRVVNGVSPDVDKHKLRCLGNAVVPQVAEFVGRELIAYDNEFGAE